MKLNIFKSSEIGFKGLEEMGEKMTAGGQVQIKLHLRTELSGICFTILFPTAADGRSV